MDTLSEEHQTLYRTVLKENEYTPPTINFGLALLDDGKVSLTTAFGKNGNEDPPKGFSISILPPSSEKISKGISHDQTFNPSWEMPLDPNAATYDCLSEKAREVYETMRTKASIFANAAKAYEAAPKSSTRAVNRAALFMADTEEYGKQLSQYASDLHRAVREAHVSWMREHPVHDLTVETLEHSGIPQDEIDWLQVMSSKVCSADSINDLRAAEVAFILATAIGNGDDQVEAMTRVEATLTIHAKTHKTWSDLKNRANELESGNGINVEQDVEAAIVRLGAAIKSIDTDAAVTEASQWSFVLVKDPEGGDCIEVQRPEGKVQATSEPFSESSKQVSQGTSFDAADMDTIHRAEKALLLGLARDAKSIELEIEREIGALCTQPLTEERRSSLRSKVLQWHETAAIFEPFDKYMDQVWKARNTKYVQSAQSDTLEKTRILANLGSTMRSAVSTLHDFLTLRDDPEPWKQASDAARLRCEWAINNQSDKSKRFQSEEKTSRFTKEAADRLAAHQEAVSQSFCNVIVAFDDVKITFDLDDSKSVVDPSRSVVSPARSVFDPARSKYTSVRDLVKLIEEANKQSEKKIRQAD